MAGFLLTTKDSLEIPLIKGEDKTKLHFIFCNTSTVDNYLFLSLHNGSNSYSWFYNIPILAYDTFLPQIEFSLGIGDKLFASSVTPGIAISIVK